ncbi:B12-binding domain-containing radical SAM protein [Anaerotignum faecicola]|nr:B12-binding domain-containing radical SAM protein [Anaerotignum faecicola]
MKILLTAINAKFIHSSLAIRYLKKSCQSISGYIECAEYTINNHEDYILTEIFKKRPDVICFSCYIWNIALVLSLAENLKKVLPKCIILCGGPEVSYESEDFIRNHSCIDIVIRGEGEISFYNTACALINNSNLSGVNGITYKDGKSIVSTPPEKPIDMEKLPFVYDSIDDLKHKIIYYETQRGCPYNCQFCLSSIEKGVRFMPLEKVYKHLDFFLKNKVRQVKFVDRTFNCSKEHSEAIWKYLIENDNGVTNFHMEIEGHIITESSIEILKNARNGLFQFEIGIQSTNPKTLEAVKRNPNFEPLKEKIIKIQELKNIHIHLDLIAGLPFEGYNSFAKSFNDVYSLYPDQLQLGFLKVLKGSGLKKDAEKYGIEYRGKAPYETLFTKDMTFEEMTLLKGIENIVETYYNSPKALNTVKYLATVFETPFVFFEKFASFWEKNGCHNVSHSKQELYTILFEFATSYMAAENKVEIITNLLKYDMLLSETLNSCPSWLPIDTSEEFKNSKRKFFSDKENVKKFLPNLINYTPAQLSRMCTIEKFSINPLEYVGSGSISKGCFYILFDYSNRNFITNHAETKEIEVKT